MANFLFDIANHHKLKTILGNYGKNTGKGNFGKIKALRSLDEEVKALNGKNIKSFASACYKNVSMRNLLNLSGFNRKDYLDLTKEKELSENFILFCFLAFAKDNSKQLIEFVSLKENLESTILKNNYDDATNKLRDIESNFGRSIWSLDASMTLDSLSNKQMSKENYSIDQSSQLSLITGYLYNKHTSHSALSFKQKSKINIVDNIRNQPWRKNYADFLSILLFPYFMDNEREFANIIKYTHKLYPVDKYIFIKKAVSELVSYNFSNNIETNSQVKEFIIEMATLNIDPSWSMMRDLFTYNLSTNIQPDIEHIIDEYTEGNYESVISNCYSYLEKKPRNLILTDLLARSIIFSQTHKAFLEKINNRDIIDVLISNLIKAYLYTDQYYSAIEYAEDLYFKLSCFDFVNTILQPFYISYPYQNNSKLEYSIYHLIGNGFSITPKFIRTLKNNKLIDTNAFLNQPRLTQSRELRENLLREADKGVMSETISDILSALKNERDITTPDYHFYEYTSLAKVKNYDSLIQRVIEKGMSKSSDLILFPMTEIAKKIDDDIDCVSNLLKAAIFSHLFQQYYDKSFRDVTSFYVDDYLRNLNLSKPSDLVSESRELSKDELFLLINVCDEPVLSGLENISDAVIMLTERLKIIDLLFEKDIKKLLTHKQIDKLSKEEVDIYQKLLVSRLTNHHAQNKIHIDFDGILELRDDYYSSAFEMIKKIQSDDISIYLDYYLSSSEGDDFLLEDKLTSQEYAKAKHYYYSIIYSNIINDFIMNNEFGLVRYLSSEIRHGVLPNHIRSVFEADNLVTSKISNDIAKPSYEIPHFWLNEINNLSSNEKLKVADHLTEFSSLIDTEIQATNNIIRPLTIPDLGEYKEAETPSTAFLFQVSEKSIKEFEIFLNIKIRGAGKASSISYDDFKSILEDFIWFILEKCFNSVRELSNEAIKPYFSAACENLINKLITIPNINKDSLIIEKIKLAKYNINEKLSDFEGWFRKPSHELDEDINISAILYASKEYIEGIYTPQKINLTFKGYEDIQWVMRNDSLLHLTRSLVTMYMNCLKHGKDKTATPISVEVVDDHGLKTIKVCNLISISKIEELIDIDIVNRVNKFSINFDNMKLIEEGGTGLYKVYKNITDAFPNARFYVELENNVFRQVIQLK